MSDPGKMVGGGAAGCGSGCLLSWLLTSLAGLAAAGSIVGEGMDMTFPSWMNPTTLLISAAAGFVMGVVSKAISKSSRPALILAIAVFVINAATIPLSGMIRGMMESQSEAVEKSMESGSAIQIARQKAQFAQMNTPKWVGYTTLVLTPFMILLGGGVLRKKDTATIEEE